MLEEKISDAVLVDDWERLDKTTMKEMISAVLSGDLERVKVLDPARDFMVNNNLDLESLLTFPCSKCPTWNVGKATEYISLLIQHNASLETADKYGETPLTTAINAQNPAFVQALLDCKAIATSDALFDALCRIDCNLTQMLLEAGAAVSPKIIDNIAKYLEYDLECDKMCLKTRKFRISIDAY